MKYKVGNQVRVRQDLKPGVKYGMDTAVDEMCVLYEVRKYGIKFKM